MLTITKTIDGEGLTDDECKSALTFSVYNKNTQQYVDKEGNLAATKTVFTMAEAGFIKDSNGTYKRLSMICLLVNMKLRKKTLQFPIIIWLQQVLTSR